MENCEFVPPDMGDLQGGVAPLFQTGEERHANQYRAQLARVAK